MPKKRLSTGIPKEWTNETATVIEQEFVRVYSMFDQLPVSLQTLGALSLSPGSLIVGAETGSGGWTVLPFVDTAQRSLTNTGAGTPAWAQVSLTLGVTGTLPATNGGTGTATVAVGDLLYGSAVNVWSKLAKDTNATRYLSNTGASNIPAWAQVNLANGVTGTLPVTNGGTGLSTVVQGDLLYGSAANVLSLLAKNTTATRYLSNTGTSNNPAWAQVDLTNGVTGTLPVTNGGTGLATATQGDLLYGSASNTYAALAKSAATYALLTNQGTSNNPSWVDVAMADQSTSGSDFTGSGAMTWTSVTVTTYKYRIIANTMLIVFKFGTSTVGGIPAIDLRVTLPAGKTAANTISTTFLYIDAGGAQAVGQCFSTASQTYLSFRKGPGTTWTAGTGTFIEGQIEIAI